MSSTEAGSAPEVLALADDVKGPAADSGESAAALQAIGLHGSAEEAMAAAVRLWFALPPVEPQHLH